MRLTKNKRANLSQIGGVLMAALAKLDERGTDETVSKAMSIVYTTIKSVERGKILNPDMAYNLALKSLGMRSK